MRAMLAQNPEADVETADSNGNTLLSEAAAGGDTGTVLLLLGQGASPNSKGEHGRTPLWRACFLGRSEAVQALLEGGADPRATNNAGESCASVASGPEAKAALAGWDLSRTEALAAELQRREEARREAAQNARRSAAEAKAEGAADAAAANERAQSALRAAYSERERRIFEYDTIMAEMKAEALLAVALDLVKQAEAKLVAAKAAAAEAAGAAAEARLAARRAEAEAQGKAEVEEEDFKAAVTIDLRDLNDVLIKDVGGLLSASGKWPVVADVSRRAATFLRYIDSNFVATTSQNAMAPEKLRRSLLGSIRYGKPLVLDLGDAYLFEATTEALDAIQPGLAASLLSKALLRGEAYLQLVRPEDGDDYKAINFVDDRLKNFMVVWVTTARFPPEELLACSHVIKVRSPPAEQ